MKKEIQIDAPKAHKNIKVIARCKRACGKTSKSVERVFSVSCRNHGINLDIYKDLNNGGQITTYADILMLNTVLESCQCIKYEIEKTDVTADSPTAENGIIKLEPTEIDKYIDIKAGIYCNVQKTFKEKQVFNVLHCAETGIVKIGGIYETTYPQTILVFYGGAVELEATRDCDYIYYSINGGEFIEVAGKSASITFDKVGFYTIDAYAVYRSKKSKVNTQNVNCVNVNVLGAGDNSYVLGAGAGKVLAMIQGE